VIRRSYYVYAHFYALSSTPFYIGKGTGYRAYTRGGRSKEWHEKAASGFEVVIFKDNLPEACAYTLERALIESVKVFNEVVNKTAGGGGTIDIKDHYLRGKVMPDWHRKAISAKQSGRLHAQFDWTVYSFYHPDHGRVDCLRSELIERYGLSPPKVCNIISGKRKTHQGWSRTT
jgi:hypothetical protein